MERSAAGLVGSARLRVSPFESRILGSLVALVFALGASDAAACWDESHANLQSQMARASQWGTIRVVGIDYSGVGIRGEKARTWIDFEWVDSFGKTHGTGRFWHEGADVEAGVLISTMPRLRVDRYYVVLLQEDSLGLKLVEEAMSVLDIEETESGKLSPWDSVRLNWVHGFFPDGSSKAVSDALLQEVVDGLGVIDALTAPAPDAGAAP